MPTSLLTPIKNFFILRGNKIKKSSWKAFPFIFLGKKKIKEQFQCKKYRMCGTDEAGTAETLRGREGNQKKRGTVFWVARDRHHNGTEFTSGFS